MDLDANDVTLGAADTYNVLAAAHDRHIDACAQAGVSSEQAALTSFMALSVMLRRFDSSVRRMVSGDRWLLVEHIMEIMYQNVEPSSTPKARA
jgi:hypothetical protein